MNVSQISGSSSNPNIWQFFVATVGLNIVIISVLAISAWSQAYFKHRQKVGWKEVLAITFGSQKFIRR
jgi:threonine/homoserine/homoserine lactone efflux protein